MFFDSVEVDFSQGEITLVRQGVRTTMPHLLAAQTEPLMVDHVLLYGMGISLWAGAEEDGHKVVLMPPGGLPFASKDICATRLAHLIIERSPLPLSLGGITTEFPWGSLKLCTAWSEGGWGAYFSIKTQADSR